MVRAGETWFNPKTDVRCEWLEMDEIEEMMETGPTVWSCLEVTTGWELEPVIDQTEIGGLF